MGLFDKHIGGLELVQHYTQLEERLRKHRNENPDWAFIFETPEKLCSVLRLKSDLGLRVKAAYAQKDYHTLAQIVKNELPDLARCVNELRLAHRTQWFATYKPFGWEVLDIRYGGLLARIDSVIKRLTDYVEGQIDHIEELEEERLYFDGIQRSQANVGLGFCNQYHRIVTAGLFSFLWPPL